MEGKVSPPSPVTPSPKTPSPDVSSPSEESPALPTTPDQRQPVSKMSLIETIYSENKSKARSAQGLLQALGTHIPTQHGTMVSGGVTKEHESYVHVHVYTVDFHL